MSISPWSQDCRLVSPDGRRIARIDETDEIGMGSPTSGILEVTGCKPIFDCNPSLVWSVDSRFLAVPIWNYRDRSQRLFIFWSEREAGRFAPGTYRVLELESFSDNVVRGVDSPVHHPRPIVVDIGPLLAYWG